jgi:MYXO-CTERM domain-containing protein
MKFISTVFLLSTVASTSYALEPTTSSLVTDVTLSLPNVYRVEDTTAYLGIAECERMISASSEVIVNYAMGVDPTEESGTQRRFEQGYTFSVPRNSTAPVTCPAGCEVLTESEYITMTAELVRFRLPFTTLSKLTSIESCTGFDTEFFLRLSLRRDSAEDTELVTSDARIIVDAERPEAPASFEVTVTQDNVNATWTLSPSDDVSQYGIYYSTTPFEGGALSNPSLGSKFVTAAGDRTSASFQVDTPADTTLYVAMVAVDENGNESLMSSVMTSNAIETEDFWENYKNAGGAEMGGCATGSGPGSGVLVLAGLLGFGMFGRSRRRSSDNFLKGRRNVLSRLGIWGVAGLVAGSVISLPSVASAESDLYGTVELKLGGYYPAIDDEVASAPFEEVFGAGTLWFAELELGFYVWQGFGKLGLAYHLGYSSVTGNALAADGSEISDETSFTVVPNRASLVYRFDILATDFYIPLVPVGKVGLDYWIWWSEGPDGETSTTTGSEAFGGKWGWHGSLGLHLLLDVIDPASAALFDHNWGVNNSYFFAEYVMSTVDDFGGEGLDLSDSMWMFGLNFEY